MTIEEKYGVISEWMAISAMFLISVAVLCYVQFVLYGFPIDVVALSGIAGGALPIVIGPALVILPWRFFQKRRQTFSNASIAVGALIFIAFLVFYVRGALLRVS